MKPHETIAVSWLDPGKVDALFALSIIELYRKRDQITHVVRVEAGGLLSRARNEAVASFMNDSPDVDWLLMIDSDERLSVEGFDKLVDLASASTRPIVGGLYFAAWTGDDIYPTPLPLAYRQSANGLTYEPLHDYPRDTRVQVDAAGTGCLLVHRSVFEAFRASADDNEGPDMCWFRDMPVRGRWYGEDVFFCARAKSLGFPIWVHTGVILPHRKSYWLTDEHHRRSRRAGTRAAEVGQGSPGDAGTAARADGQEAEA